MLPMLGYSTIDHLKMIKEFNERIARLQDELADAETRADMLQQDFDEKHATLTAVIEMKNKERRFRIAIEDKEREIKELEQQLKLEQRPWYKRLLG
jgi:septal ring factor EnvC (AmiA/AmiB activator)